MRLKWYWLKTLNNIVNKLITSTNSSNTNKLASKIMQTLVKLFYPYWLYKEIILSFDITINNLYTFSQSLNFLILTNYTILKFWKFNAKLKIASKIFSKVESFWMFYILFSIKLEISKKIFCN